MSMEFLECLIIVLEWKYFVTIPTPTWDGTMIEMLGHAAPSLPTYRS